LQDAGGTDARDSSARLEPPRREWTADTPAITLVDLERWLRGYASRITAEKDHLNALDAAIGDGDYGINMDRGFQEVLVRLSAGFGPDETPAALFKFVGTTLLATVGGTSGVLYATFFRGLASVLGDATLLSPSQLVSALRAGLDGVAARGHAQLDDKTMLDAMTPAVQAIEEAVGAGRVPAAFAEGARAATAGSERVIPLVARKGRASYLGSRSAGHEDPGATATAYLFDELCQALWDDEKDSRPEITELIDRPPR
jgi:dihydroxyacetone kinase-like protein